MKAWLKACCSCLFPSDDDDQEEIIIGPVGTSRNPPHRGSGRLSDAGAASTSAAGPSSARFQPTSTAPSRTTVRDPSKPSGLDLSKLRIDRIPVNDTRFVNRIPNDDNSPITPTNFSLSLYQDHTRLPRPLISKEDPKILEYGRVKVPVDGQYYYEMMRTRMVNSGGKPLKYLVSLEQGDGPKVEISPFVAGDGIPLIIAGSPADKIAQTSVRQFTADNGRTEGRVCVRFPVNQGVVTYTGSFEFRVG